MTDAPHLTLVSEKNKPHPGRRPVADKKRETRRTLDYLRLGQAFRDQEGDLQDLQFMARIAARAAQENAEGSGTTDEALFTAHHLCDMIDDFRKQWYRSHKKAEVDAP